MIPQKLVNQIIETAQIDDVVSDFVPLKKRGSNFVACCPFHNEKTPSFSVSPSKGIYKCFGCGEAGNSVKFVMEHENFSFPETLKYLAQKYNITWEEIEDEKGKDEQQRLDSLFIVNQFAQDHFQNNLRESDEGKSVGLSYFKSRGYNDSDIEGFGLGYSLNNYDDFLKEAEEKGYSVDLLKQVGLVREKDGRKYPFFRGRVMFPIHNLSGKVIAFAGRILDNSNKKAPKYVNSPETEIYFKSKILYGMFQAKRAIRKQDECYLVEGYTDVISLHKGGVENSVASSGTSLTVDQIRLVKRYTNNITLLFDGDAAGIKAALRGVDLILEQGLDVKVIQLPDDEDPDSFIQENGKPGFDKFVEENKKDFILFKTRLLLEEAAGDPIRKTELIRSIIESLSKIPDPIKRALYIRECAGLLDLEEATIIQETNALKRKQLQKMRSDADRIEAQNEALALAGEPPIRREGEATEKIKLESQEQKRFSRKIGRRNTIESELVKVMLEFGSKPYKIGEDLNPNYVVSVFVIQQISGFPFHDKNCQQIIDIFKEHLQEGKKPEKDFFLQYDYGSVSQIAANVLATPYSISQNWNIMHDILIDEMAVNFNAEVTHLVGRYKLVCLDTQIQENAKDIKASKTEEEITKHLKIKKVLDEQRGALSNDLGTVITG